MGQSAAFASSRAVRIPTLRDPAVTATADWLGLPCDDEDE
jgi:hypothetical protein